MSPCGFEKQLHASVSFGAFSGFADNVCVDQIHSLAASISLRAREVFVLAYVWHRGEHFRQASAARSVQGALQNLAMFLLRAAMVFRSALFQRIHHIDGEVTHDQLCHMEFLCRESRYQ